MALDPAASVSPLKELPMKSAFRKQRRQAVYPLRPDSHVQAILVAPALYSLLFTSSLKVISAPGHSTAFAFRTCIRRRRQKRWAVRLVRLKNARWCRSITFTAGADNLQDAALFSPFFKRDIYKT